MLRTVTVVAALIWLGACASAQAQHAQQGPLLDRLTGDWVLRGNIAGQPVVHDVRAQWVLNDEYLRLHEVSRERDENGAPQYEAIVFIDWIPEAGEYNMLWLDSTGGGGLAAHTIARGVPNGSSIPFMFLGADGSRLHNTFSYSAQNDVWRWIIENEANGARTRFADVMLEREE